MKQNPKETWTKVRHSLFEGHVKTIWVIPPYVGLFVIGLGLQLQKSDTDKDQSAYMEYTREIVRYQVQNIEYKICLALDLQRTDDRAREEILIDIVRDFDLPEEADRLQKALDETSPITDILTACPSDPVFPEEPERLND